MYYSEPAQRQRQRDKVKNGYREEIDYLQRNRQIANCATGTKETRRPNGITVFLRREKIAVNLKFVPNKTAFQ